MVIKKIAITADIHYGTLTREEQLEDFVQLMNKEKMDFLLIGGDLASRGGDHNQFKQALGILKKFNGKVLFTPGNHDLWTRKGDSFDLLTKKLPLLFEESGHHMLDMKPYIIDKLGIVGSIGWYDYSFKTVPEYLRTMFGNYLFKFSTNENDKRIVSWNGITHDDYANKLLLVSKDGLHWSKSSWMDRKFIKWDLTDEQFLDYCLTQLKSDIESINDKVDEILVLTHHLPFNDFVPDIPDPTWGFHRAYLGSEKIGQLLRKYPKVKYVFFGHAHKNKSRHGQDLFAQNLFFCSPPGYTLFEYKIQE